MMMFYSFNSFNCSSFRYKKMNVKEAMKKYGLTQNQVYYLIRHDILGKVPVSHGKWGARYSLFVKDKDSLDSFILYHKEKKNKTGITLATIVEKYKLGYDFHKWFFAQEDAQYENIRIAKKKSYLIKINWFSKWFTEEKEAEYKK